MRLSCAEIRRVFWAVVVAGQPRTTEILQWSQWRRWHQAWARYYHYRRRERADAAPQVHPPPDTPIDLVTTIWTRLVPFLPPPTRRGRPYAHDRRQIVEAIVYLMQTGCPWNALPSQFPPWQTVYAQLVQWRRSGVWDTVWAGLNQPQAIP